MIQYTGELKTYENNSMSLSCSGIIKLVNNEVVEVSFKGFPRAHGDGWTIFYRETKVGDFVSPHKLERVLSYNGRHNLVSTFKGEVTDG